MKMEEMRKESQKYPIFYNRTGVPSEKSKMPDYISCLTKDQINEQIRMKCQKCGSDAKTSALNKETGRIMITCLKCNDWIDFK